MFTHLVMSGGGLLGIAYIGMLRYLYQEKLDKDIVNVYGTSMGAMFGAAFVLGVPVDTMERRFKYYLSETNDFTKTDICHMFSWHLKYGIDDGSRNLIFVKEELGNMTFVDLAKKTGKNLVVCATHVVTMSPTYFSVDTTPNVLVTDALRASMAIPMVFTPVKIGMDYYIDGCMTHGVPLSHNIPKQSTLIVYLQAASQPRNIDMENTNMMDYVMGVLVPLLFKNNNTRNILGCNYPHFLCIESIPMNPLPIQFSEHYMTMTVDAFTIDECISIGYHAIYDHIKAFNAASASASASASSAPPLTSSAEMH